MNNGTKNISPVNWNKCGGGLAKMCKMPPDAGSAADLG
jgi:hypothetical protein